MRIQSTQHAYTEDAHTFWPSWEIIVREHELGPRPRPVHLSIVIPVYGGGEALSQLVARIDALISEQYEGSQIILVDDASEKVTARAASECAQRHRSVILLRFSRNYGQHAALLAGIRAATNDIVVTLDDDGQQCPDDIPRLVDGIVHFGLDVCYGYPIRRSETVWRRAAGQVVRNLIGRISGQPRLRYTSPFRAFRTNLRDAFEHPLGPGISLDVLLSWTTERFGHVEVRHQARADGASGYTLRKLVRFASDTLTGYSTSLLNVVTALGFAAVALGLGILGWVLGRYFLVGASVAGFPFLASTIALFSGAQMLSLGIIGQYLGRIHVRVQGRPSYHIVERVFSGVEQHAQERAE